MLQLGATTLKVLREFSSRFTGSLRDWFESLGPYRQLQFVQFPELSTALGLIYDQFLGDQTASVELVRKEYMEMKCCSLQQKDLDYHYKRMYVLFYKLDGFNNPTLKHVFIASLPKELQPELQRQINVNHLNVPDMSIGKIYQLAVNCLAQLYEQK